jgi:excisionase family DNA binding protein
MRIVLELSDEVVEAIAERAADLVVARQPRHGRGSPYLTVAEAAEQLRCKPQRLYDLASAGRLSRYKDGSRVLLSRGEIDAHLTGERRSPIAPSLPLPPRRRSKRGLAV